MGIGNGHTQPTRKRLPARMAGAVAMAVVTSSLVSVASATAQGFRLQPSISTTATPEAIVGGSIFDTATVTGPAGAPAPTGTVTFTVFGGVAPCSGSPVFTSGHRLLSGAPPAATSTAFTPSSAGFYHWVVTYIGDAHYLPATPACGTVGETSNVSKALPTLVTRATPTAAVSQPISDTATLSGGFNPTGTITFTLFSDPVCSTAVFVSAPVPVNGNGDYASPPVGVTATGSHFWRATYSGDRNNLGVENPCQDANETSVIFQVTPTVVAQATPPGPVNLGQPISGTAALSGASEPTGSITFRAFGPNDATCAAAPFFSRTVQVTGNGNYSSGFFTPTAAGRYNWVAAYSGDLYNPAAASACGAPGATSVVRAIVAMATTATPHASLGNPISDTARVTVQAGLPAATGTVKFTLYGPNDATCSRPPIFTSDDQPLSGRPPTATATFTPTQGGDYRWTARYSGDDTYPALASACNDPNQTSVVDSRVPTLTAQATPSATIGQPINDTATLSGAFNPKGSMTFTAFGPDNPACIGAPAFTATVPAGVTTGSGNFTPRATGSYNWIAAYSGDANHQPLTTACGDPGSITTVRRGPPAIATRATPTARVGTPIAATVTVTGPTTAPAPTGTVTFAVYGPNNTTCAGAAVFTSANRPLSGGSRPIATSATFTPGTPGTYRWVVFYSGDANYLAATSSCNASGATSTVTSGR